MPCPTLTNDQLRMFRDHGHVTIMNVFTQADMDAAVADAMTWANETVVGLDARGRQWYLDAGATVPQALRKLDDPVFHRQVFRNLACDPRLVGRIESLLGPGVSIAFSQIFFKPPGGAAKPAHQDNFYFGPSREDGMITAWLALDEATAENGCLNFAGGSHKHDIVPHVAPNEPFNLNLPDDELKRWAMRPAPVPRGGVSLHHGNVYHASGPNHSDRWRRAAAMHYIARDVTFANPAWPYDASKTVRVANVE